MVTTQFVHVTQRRALTPLSTALVRADEAHADAVLVVAIKALVAVAVGFAVALALPARLLAGAT
jgi:hypothetical protein